MGSLYEGTIEPRTPLQVLPDLLFPQFLYNLIKGHLFVKFFEELQRFPLGKILVRGEHNSCCLM